VPLIRLAGHAILRERLVSKGDRQVLPVQPYRDRLASQPPFTIDAPMPEAL
jgi:hypothetical protein